MEGRRGQSLGSRQFCVLESVLVLHMMREHKRKTWKTEVGQVYLWLYLYPSNFSPFYISTVLSFPPPYSHIRIFTYTRALQVALVIKNLPSSSGDVRDITQVRSLGQEDPLEMGMTIHSSIPA